MNDSQELKKHVHVIHSYSKFTLVQRKLVNALLYNAYYELPNKSVFQLKTKDLCELIGYQSRDIAGLKRSLRGLMATVIEWNVIDGSSKDRDKWTATTMLSSAEIYRGVCTYSYSELMKELLYQPEIYGNIDIMLMKQFKSNYGLALYENCIRFQKIKHTAWFNYQTFRRLMGISEGKYKAFKDLKKRVIDVAVNEVNLISPISVTAEIDKKEHRIRFLIDKKKAETKSLSENEQQAEVISQLIDLFGVAVHVAKKLIVEYEIEYIKEKISIITASASFKAGSINHLAGYLLDALAKDYKAPVSSKEAVKKVEKQKNTAKEKAKAIDKKLNEQYAKYINEVWSKIEASLNDSEVTQLKENYLSLVNSNQILKKFYKSTGFSHPMIKGGYRDFVRNAHPEKFAHVMTEDEFRTIFA